MESSVYTRERNILGTIISCNNVIRSSNLIYPKLKNKLFENCEIYDNVFNNLARETSLNEEFEYSQFNQVKMNEHHNYYAYFRKVDEFLNTYDLDSQHSLNESLKINYPKVQNLGGGKLIENPFKMVNSNSIIGIETFKNELKYFISELEKMDDPNNYDKKVITIKTLARKNIFVSGFNIMNSLMFQSEICKKFNLNSVNLYAVLYDKLHKNVLFVYANNIIIAYNINTDEFNKMVIASNYDNSNYLKAINQSITYMVIPLWHNLSSVKFTDNLYMDKTIQANMEKLKSKIITKQ